MGLTAFEVAAKLTFDKGDFDKGVKAAAQSGEGLAGSLTGSFKKIAAAAATYLSVQAIGGVMKNIWDVGKAYNQQMEDYTTNFKVMLGGNVDAAKAKVAELAAFAASTPFGMDSLAQGTQTLLAFGIESERTTGLLRMMGDVSLGDAGKLQSLTNAFGKASASGKVTGEVIQSMTAQGFNPLLELSNMTGESMESLNKRMSAGKLTVEELEQAFVHATSEGGQFFNGMKEASKTLSGMLSTLGDNWNALMGKVTAPFYKVYEEQIVPALLHGVEGLTAVLDKNEDKINAFATSLGDFVGGALDWVINGFDWLLANGDKVGPILLTIAGGAGVLFAAMNPVGAAIAAVTAGIVALIVNWDKLKDLPEVKLTVEFASGLAEGAYKWAKDVWDGANRALKGLFLTIGWSLVRALEAWDWAKGVWDSASKAIGQAIKIVVEWEHNLAAVVGEWAKGVWDGANAVLSPAIHLLVEWNKGLAAGAGQWAKGIYDEVVKWMNATFGVNMPDAATIIKQINEWWNNLIKNISLALGFSVVQEGPAEPQSNMEGATATDYAAAKQAAGNGYSYEDIVSGKARRDAELAAQLAQGIATGGSTPGKMPAASTPARPQSNATTTVTNAMNSMNLVTQRVTTGGGVLPGHAAGLPNVPWDGYIAELHRGERVMTAAENRQRREGSTAADMDAVADKIAAAVVEAMRGVRIDMDGQQVGALVADEVDRAIATKTNARRYAAAW